MILFLSRYKSGVSIRSLQKLPKVVLAIENRDDHAGLAKASLASQVNRNPIRDAFKAHPEGIHHQLIQR